MSHIQVRLSQDPAPKGWSEKGPLSFDQQGAHIHIGHLDSSDALRAIRKAARMLDSTGVAKAALSDSWSFEQQWAFASSFSSPKKQDAVQWADDGNSERLQQHFDALRFTRNLINRSPEDISPEVLAEEASNWLRQLGGERVQTRVTKGEALKEAGWIGIYEVGRGSERPPVLLEVDYNPTGDDKAPVATALVGKGITFDSGGYSIKGSEGMLSMKCDMGGAATVTGAMGLAIMQGLNKRVKLFLCCAENLISGHAYKLGDILTYKNGVTVEVVNTDAEGRLVLADGLMAAGESGARTIIDAATLTGAAMVAVGTEYNALFGLDKELQQQILGYAQQEAEPTWPLPLERWHQDNCPSPYADTANSRPMKGGGAGGASNAAGFLSRFVPNDGKGWAHIDLASAFNSSATSLMPAGASGQGIRTIARALLEN
ncbi:PepB aminopeptidase [Saliniradius amylolyticus]|uniref:PepB aminopeptidase n=1 Tax=Saliniradius amylolyticus TaxID=2183582 RepID=A0A2S2DZZ7_9ALTE|nr:aminopeptidase PepB [Saliniradius amylolyticus]AWL10862.1 PepB aminopeptidase [Saliniradius amylolyticus]